MVQLTTAVNTWYPLHFSLLAHEDFGISVGSRTPVNRRGECLLWHPKLIHVIEAHGAGCTKNGTQIDNVHTSERNGVLFQLTSERAFSISACWPPQVQPSSAFWSSQRPGRHLFSRNCCASPSLEVPCVHCQVLRSCTSWEC